ncbi:EH domain-containing protein [Entamoeba marina]
MLVVFWEEPFKDSLFTSLFEGEREDLMRELHALPKQATVRKVNELCKRARYVKANAYITSYLREQMPTFGKEKKKAELLHDLNGVFNAVLKRYNLAIGDFPPLETYRERLSNLDFSKFQKLDVKLIAAIDDALATQIPTLLKKFPMEDDMKDKTNPFEVQSSFEQCCITLEVSDDEIDLYAAEFNKLPKNEFGKVSGQDCFAPLMSTGAEKKDLMNIWSIVDSGKEGAINEHQYVIAKALIRCNLQSGTYPQNLPPID